MLDTNKFGDGITHIARVIEKSTKLEFCGLN